MLANEAYTGLEAERPADQAVPIDAAMTMAMASP